MRASSVIVAVSLALGLAGALATAAAAEIKLPPDTSRLRVSKLAGYAVAQQKCGICHSADYINFQPPGMSLVQWTAEMKKMKLSYGAPLSDAEVELVSAYLAVTYGSAKATDPAVVALSSKAAPPTKSQGGAIDVKALLDANACLGCHAVDKKVVGPAFKAVAAKYKGVANATASLSASIKQGGSGKWGDVAMPPMAGLSAAQAEALAAFVLKQ